MSDDRLNLNIREDHAWRWTKQRAYSNSGKVVDAPATTMITAEPGGVESLCMATADASCDFKPLQVLRRPVGEYDVLIDMKYCGVCHSDLHSAAAHNSQMRAVQYPHVPGHELAGIVEAVGAKVSKVRVGQKVGVGCLVDSCLCCSKCDAGLEQKCPKSVGTYQGQDNGSGRALRPGDQTYTQGGYTTKHVCHEHFVIIIPESHPLQCAGPIMCAGITMYDPLKAHGMGPGNHVGIVGLGG